MLTKPLKAGLSSAPTPLWFGWISGDFSRRENAGGGESVQEVNKVFGRIGADELLPQSPCAGAQSPRFTRLSCLKTTVLILVLPGPVGFSSASSYVTNHRFQHPARFLDMYSPSFSQNRERHSPFRSAGTSRYTSRGRVPSHPASAADPWAILCGTVFFALDSGLLSADDADQTAATVRHSEIRMSQDRYVLLVP